MLPFQIEPPPPVGMSPAEAALRQRQRMLQAGVFVCCLLLLLDTRVPPPSRFAEDAAGGAGYLSSAESIAAAQNRMRLDEAIVSSSRHDKRKKFANVTGLYQGQWSIASRNASKKAASRPVANSGIAVIHVEMMAAEGFSELSAARALISLADESGSTDKADAIFVSAFGVYFHSLGRLVMVANVGNPQDALRLEWRRKSDEMSHNLTQAVPGLPPKHQRRNRTRSFSAWGQGGGRPSYHEGERRRLTLEESNSVSRRTAADESATKTASVTIPEGVVKGYELKLVVQGVVPAEAVRKKGRRQGQSNFTLEEESPLVKQLAADNRTSLSVGDGEEARFDEEGLAGGLFTLKPERRLGYPTRPLVEDVWRRARCAFLVDLEEVPNDRKKMTATAALAQRVTTDELALKLVGSLTGCGISIEVGARANRIDWEAARRAALGYSLLMNTICVFQIALLFRQLHFSRTQAVAARVSLICVAAQSLIDAVLCVANLLLCAAVQNLFAAFAAVAFFELVIFCVVEMRYVVVVFQAHDPQRFWIGSTTRRQLALLHAQFYFALFAALCAVYFCRDDVRLVTLIAYSFWVPQIVRNARDEYWHPFHDSYLYGMALSRLVAPLYVYAYPYSLVSVILPNAKLRPLFCLGLVAWQGAQVAVLKAQSKFGPRFFVPSCFLPARYNYRRPLPAIATQRQRHRHPPSNTISESTGTTTAIARSVSSASLSSRPAATSSSAVAASEEVSSDPPNSGDVDDGDRRGDVEDGLNEAGIECVICFQDVSLSGNDYLITPCDHVRLLFVFFRSHFPCK